MVTAEEFDAAVKQVIHDQVSDPKLDGMGWLASQADMLADDWVFAE